jgi:NADPH:quinone reductase-like Zn-dependent oxidoreductase
MEAIVGRSYGPPERLRVEDVAEPVAEAGEVVVRVRAAGVNAGDWRLTRGRPYVARPMMGGLRGPNPPVRGWDLAGVVETVGEEVDDLEPGDEVFGSSGATFADLASADSTRLAPKPPGLSFVDAAAIPVAGISALQSLRKAEVRPGQRVLVHGAAGGVGTFAVQLAKLAGAEVTGVCGARKSEFVASLGADHVVDYTQTDFTRERERYDVIVDNVGNRSLRSMRRVLAPDGTLVVVGGGHGSILGPLRTFAAVFVMNRLVRQRLMPFLAKPNRADLSELANHAVEGRLRVVVDRTYPFAQAPEAIAYVESGHPSGKVVVVR